MRGGPGPSSLPPHSPDIAQSCRQLVGSSLEPSHVHDCSSRDDCLLTCSLAHLLTCLCFLDPHSPRPVSYLAYNLRPVAPLVLPQLFERPQAHQHLPACPPAAPPCLFLAYRAPYLYLPLPQSFAHNCSTTTRQPTPALHPRYHMRLRLRLRLPLTC
jgi:hypothetical protein